jgi:hypothetical protein
MAMDKALAKLTVCFEEPFWVGIYECKTSESYEVCKITFGAEPKDYEVYYFLLNKSWHLNFSKSLELEKEPEKRINPKRLQREIEKQLHNTGMGTKVQQALKLQHEAGKQKRKAHSRKLREEEQKRQFELHQSKRKEKHKGH